MIRVALIGTEGVGKSSVGNTLLGSKKFPLQHLCERLCSTEIGRLPNGKIIKVVDTPGITNKTGIVNREVTKAIEYLSPGPHAFLIIISPGSVRQHFISELRELFGDEHFLNHAIIVMVRKNEISFDDGKTIEIHEFISKYATEMVKELYNICGKRIVAVENKAASNEMIQKYAIDIASEIEKLGQTYYSRDYFLARQRLHEKEEKIKTEDTKIKRLEEELQRMTGKRQNNFCTMC